MARVNVYLPDDLADRARSAGLNVSAVARSALETQLSADAASDWLERTAALPNLGIESGEVTAAVHAARDELDSG